MKRLAITGGLASGKSTVAALLRERGVPVVDADELGRELWPGMQPQLEALFGQGRTSPAQVAEVVFADGEKLAALNRLMHPAILARAAAQLDAWEREGHWAAGVEAALLIEAGLLAGFDRVVLVVADEEERVRRYVSRTGARTAAGEAEARARMARQWTDAEKLPRADVVIHNKGSMAELAAQVDAFLEALR